MIDPALKRALRHLRAVKSREPARTDSPEFADWSEQIARALEAVAPLLLFGSDRFRAGAEAETARARAAETRRRHTLRPADGDPAPD